MGGIWSLILMERHRYVWWNAILKMALLLSAMWNRKVVGWIFIALFLTGMVSQIGCSGEGGDNRWLMPAAGLLGGAFVLVCDVAARVLFAPFELPVGIVMSLLGGPFVLHLLLRRGRGRVYA